MLRKQNGFAVLELVFLFFVLTSIVVGAFFVYSSKQRATVVSRPVSRITVKTITQHDAFLLLNKAYEAKLLSSQKECSYADGSCLGNSLGDADKVAIAKAYGITNDNQDTIFFGLQKGKSLDVGGIGTGYLDNKSKLAINDSTWYWEIGSCSTNNRIFIDALTGTSTGINSWTYCSRDVDELDAPN